MNNVIVVKFMLNQLFKKLRVKDKYKIITNKITQLYLSI